MGSWRSFAKSGAPLSYGPRPEHWARLAVQVDKIFRGAKISEIPVEQPAQFDLGINVKTARTLGVTIPPSVLLRANERIEG